MSSCTLHYITLVSDIAIFVLKRDVKLQLTNITLHSPHFLAHVYCGQTAGWIKMPLGTQVGLGPGHIVLDGDRAPPPQKWAQRPNFWFMSIVARRSPISATAEYLFNCPASHSRCLGISFTANFVCHCDMFPSAISEAIRAANCRRTHGSWLGLRFCSHPAVSLHLSNEPGELLQWPWSWWQHHKHYRCCYYYETASPVLRTLIDAVCCYWPSSVVCRSVCHTSESLQKRLNSSRYHLGWGLGSGQRTMN